LARRILRRIVRDKEALGMANVVQMLSDIEAEQRKWQLRCDMAAVFRVFARHGWNEQIGNHNSLMLP